MSRSRPGGIQQGAPAVKLSVEQFIYCLSWSMAMTDWLDRVAPAAFIVFLSSLAITLGMVLAYWPYPLMSPPVAKVLLIAFLALIASAPLACHYLYTLLRERLSRTQGRQR